VHALLAGIDQRRADVVMEVCPLPAERAFDDVELQDTHWKRTFVVNLSRDSNAIAVPAIRIAEAVTVRKSTPGGYAGRPAVAAGNPNPTGTVCPRLSVSGRAIAAVRNVHEQSKR
jgi:hypothetical protein